MSKRHHPHKKKKQPGSPPGTLEFLGHKRLENPLVMQVRFGGDHFSMNPVSDWQIEPTTSGLTTWYDVRGLHDVSLIEQIGSSFGIHPLVLEDILNTVQRPKYEEYGKEVFVVLSSFSFDTQTQELIPEQISIYFGEHFLITFQENEDDTFLAVRERLRVGKGRIRSRKSDYLAYALIDNVVDNYFLLLDDIEAEMEAIEELINVEPGAHIKEKIHHLKFQLLTLRKSVMPLREAVGRFSRSDSPYVDESTGIFLRDLHDHVIRISDLIETYRDMLNGLQELYLSELSIRMNNVMQVLTIITTIFVPLSFLAGLYGMNFDNMPELHVTYGYFYLLGIMLLIVIFSLWYFRRKKWM